MDKKAAELSRAGLRLFSKEMSHEYDAVRERLIGYLAANNSTIEQLGRREESARANRSMLSRFIQLLPNAKLVDRDWLLELKDPYTARILQSITLWSSEVSGQRSVRYENQTSTYYTYGLRPYVVLGKKGEENNELLVACIGEDDHKSKTRVARRYGELFIYEPGRKDRKNIKNMNYIQSSEYPTPADMEILFNQDKHVLELNAGSPRATKLKHPVARWELAEPLERIFDEQLAQFDVNSHVNRIATALGLEEQWEKLVTAHSV
jgi:hypothetical protein